jgi:hypothetical protein
MPKPAFVGFLLLSPTLHGNRAVRWPERGTPVAVVTVETSQVSSVVFTSSGPPWRW